MSRAPRDRWPAAQRAVTPDPEIYTLRPTLSARSATLITAGAMIGTGIFASVTDVARASASALWVLLAWLAGGVLSLLGALSFAEAGSRDPQTGGLLVYLERAFGPATAACFGWAMLSVLLPSSVAFFAQTAARNLLAAVGVAGVAPTRLLALVFVALLVATNVRATSWGARLQDGLTGVKLVALVLLTAMGLRVGWLVSHAQLPALVSVGARGPATGGGTSFATALVSVLWTYDGWIDVTSVGGELRDPKRDMPRALVGGTLLVMALYLLVNCGYLAALGVSGLAASATPAVTLAQGLGAELGALVSLMVAVAALGGGAVGLMSGARVVHAAAVSGLLPSGLARVSRWQTPARALTLSAVLAVAHLLSPLGGLGEVFVVGAWPFYALGALAIVRLRRRDQLGARDGFSTPWFPWPQRVFALVSVAIVAMYAVQQPKRTGLSLGLIALGPWVWRLSMYFDKRSRRVASLSERA
ncbi:MAG: amino acid permease [Deltaproteobacteria bacterium]|nr:amino acid permease [Deltaproteobacteria bacterium]